LIFVVLGRSSKEGVSRVMASFPGIHYYCKVLSAVKIYRK